jgi:hypothetical protein
MRNVGTLRPFEAAAIRPAGEFNLRSLPAFNLGVVAGRLVIVAV